MKKIMQKRWMVFVVIGIFLGLYLELITGFGVGIPYWETQTVPMARGEKRVFDINLQNMVGEEDLIAKIEVVEGKDLIKLEKEEYLVKSGTHSVNAPITIKIPRNATGGEHQKIKLIVKSGGVDGGGPITMGVGAKVEFDILVTDEIIALSIFENKFLYMIGALIIILILIILFVVFRRKKRKKEKSDKRKGMKKDKKEKRGVIATNRQ